MKNPTQKILTAAVCSLALVLFAGCASTKVSNRVENVSSTEKVPKPDHIWVYDFAATADEVPDQSALKGADTATQTDEQIVLGRKLGAQIAEQLVEEFKKLGLPAVLGDATMKPAVNDLVIKGYLLTVDEGSAAKRVTLGFGAGGSKLQVAVEGFQMTATGLRRLGSGNVDSGAAKGPGMAVGVAAFVATANPVGLVVNAGTKVYGEASGKSKVDGRAKSTVEEIVKVLKPRFEQQGWIK